MAVRRIDRCLTTRLRTTSFIRPSQKYIGEGGRGDRVLKFDAAARQPVCLLLVNERSRWVSLSLSIQTASLAGLKQDNNRRYLSPPLANKSSTKPQMPKRPLSTFSTPPILSLFSPTPIFLASTSSSLNRSITSAFSLPPPPPFQMSKLIIARCFRCCPQAEGGQCLEHSLPRRDFVCGCRTKKRHPRLHSISRV